MIGLPDKVIDGLKKHADDTGLSGQSREEFEAALPHLIGLVEQNIVAGVPANPQYPKLIKINASGHGSKKDGAWTERNCSASVEYSYTKILI
jgi:hypothetical protein